jgi:hypothetical protein
MPAPLDDDELHYDVDVDMLVARLNNLYPKRGVSPPFRLRETAKRWLAFEEIVSTAEQHFEKGGYRYRTTGEEWFGCACSTC